MQFCKVIFALSNERAWSVKAPTSSFNQQQIMSCIVPLPVWKVRLCYAKGLCHTNCLKNRPIVPPLFLLLLHSKIIWCNMHVLQFTVWFLCKSFFASTNKNLLLESSFNQQELKESNNDLIECIDMIFNQQQNNDNTAKSSLGKLL